MKNKNVKNKIECKSDSALLLTFVDFPKKFFAKTSESKAVKFARI